MDGRLGVLRLILRDAKMREHIAKSPFDEPLPKRRTKRTQAQMSKKVTFRPFVADELETLLAVLRDPHDSIERMYFPVTEALLLTGLRWGEGAAWIWPHISQPERLIYILHALPKSRTVDVSSLVATDHRKQDTYQDRDGSHECTSLTALPSAPARIHLRAAAQEPCSLLRESRRR